MNHPPSLRQDLFPTDEELSGIGRNNLTEAVRGVSSLSVATWLHSSTQFDEELLCLGLPILTSHHS